MYSMVMGNYTFGSRITGINDMPINDKLLVEKGDIQFFRQALADLVAAASVLTRNGNNR